MLERERKRFQDRLSRPRGDEGDGERLQCNREKASNSNRTSTSARGRERDAWEVMDEAKDRRTGNVESINPAEQQDQGDPAQSELYR